MAMGSRTYFGGGGNDLYGTAQFQADALEGMGGGGGTDLMSLLDQLRRRKQEAQLGATRMPAQPIPQYTGGPYGPESGFAAQQRYRNFRNMFDREQTAAQRASSMMGGPQSMAFGDTARQMAAMQAAGLPVPEYTGMTELARAGAGASAQAEESAGRNRRLLKILESGGTWRE